MSVKKRILEVTIFLLVMFLTFYTLFSGKNLGEIANAVSKMSVGYLVPAAALAIFFVCAEGYMIWYLLQAMKANRRKEGSSLIRCIQYSFIGFFYSGITPSATGGQPVQLYYMSKDGNRGSDSTVVLMTVAVVYKFVLVILGAAILLFWYRPLYSELGKFFPLYLSLKCPYRYLKIYYASRPVLSCRGAYDILILQKGGHSLMAETFHDLRGHILDYLYEKGINPAKRFHCLNPNHLDRNPSMGYDSKRQKVPLLCLSGGLRSFRSSNAGPPSSITKRSTSSSPRNLGATTLSKKSTNNHQTMHPTRIVY